MDRELTQYQTTNALAARQALYAFTSGPTRADFVREALNGFPEMSVLDAGCGNGTLIADVLKTHSNARLWLLDSSEGMVNEAKGRVRSTATIIGDLASARFDAFFDRIVVAHALHLADDKAAALAHLVNHLAPGGRMVVTMHSGTDFPKRREWIAWFETTFDHHSKTKRDSLHLQNFESLTKNIPGTIETRLIETRVRLTNPEPYLRYIDTERHRWEREPTNAEWSAYLEHVRADIRREITTNGSFLEPHEWGLATIQLPRKPLPNA